MSLKCMAKVPQHKTETVKIGFLLPFFRQASSNLPESLTMVFTQKKTAALSAGPETSYFRPHTHAQTHMHKHTCTNTHTIRATIVHTKGRCIILNCACIVETVS